MNQVSGSLMGVSVILPILNEERDLRESVSAILAQNYSGAFEVILALGPSSDRTNKIAKEFEDYRFITKGQRELLVLSDDQVCDECKQLYKKIQKKYGKTNVELRTAVKESKKVIKNVNCRNY